MPRASKKPIKSFHQRCIEDGEYLKCIDHLKFSDRRARECWDEFEEELAPTTPVDEYHDLVTDLFEQFGDWQTVDLVLRRMLDAYTSGVDHENQRIQDQL